MNLPFALNTILGSALVVILIFINCSRKYNVDRYLKSIFLRLLVFIFIPMAIDFVYLLFNGTPGRPMHILLYSICSSYYFFDVLAYCYVVLLVDYLIFKDAGRYKKLNVFILCVAAVHAAALALNVKYHFYFYIHDVSNLLVRGDKYYFRVIFTYCPLLLSVWDLIFSRNFFKKSHFALMFLLLGFSFSGLTVDIAFGDTGLVWPCFAAAMLYAYFFIIQADNRIDSLTGIGNRYSFNEFTNHLSRSSSGETWAIVMIDMDHFKEINDKLGHLEGDNALRDMAAIILRCVSTADFAARYGGDEFVLAAKGETGAEELMAKINAAIELHNAKNTRPFKLELSYGSDVYAADGKHSMDEFLAHIDSLMYKNKQNRRRSSDKGGGI